jgi:hypothetical protein
VREADKKGVRFSEAPRDGVAWLNGVSFEKGGIEIDLRGKDLFQQSFLGIAFHGENDSTYEAVYFRPFNFLASDSVRRIHAVQYISHPDFTWKRLREQQNGVFEKEVVPAPDPNAWFHARVIVTETTVDVYVNQHPKPCLQAKRLSNRQGGKVGLWVGDRSGGDFADLRIWAE